MAIAQVIVSAVTAYPLTSIASTLATFLLFRSIYRLSPLHPLSTIPGPLLPRLSSLWLNYHAFIGDEATAVHALHDKFGRIVRTGPSSVDIADGSVLNTIYLDKAGFLKPDFYHNFDIDGHTTLFSSTLPSVRTPRAKAVLPVFSTGNIQRGAAHLLSAAAKGFVDRLERELARSKETTRRVDVLPIARGFALDAVSSYLLDRNYGACEEDLSLKDQAKAAKGPMSAADMVDSFVAVGKNWYLPPWAFQLYESIVGYVFPDPQATQSIAKVDLFLVDVIDQAKKNPQGTSFPNRLLAAGFATAEVTAQCKDLIFAGTDSTAMNLATICFMLAKSPKTYELLKQEMATKQPSDEDLQSLPYLQAVIKEGLRLSMANPSRLPRVVPAAGMRYKSVFMPAGTVVSCTPYELHHDPAVFPEPFSFKPERWAEATDEMKRDLIPFGHGPRQCIARNLAMAELTKVVSVVAAEDRLRGLSNVGDKIEILEWFNSHVTDHKIELELTS